MSEYPDQQVLDQLAEMPVRDAESVLAILTCARDNWIAPYGEVRVNAEGNVFTFITGGWSGNEDIIDAMERNRTFWLLSWWKSERGGLVEFRLPQRLSAENP